MIKNVIFAVFFACAAGFCLKSAEAQASKPIPLVTRYCTAAPGAKAVADSLAVRFRNILQPMFENKAITRPNVRVSYSGPRVKLQRVPVDFSSGLDVGFDLGTNGKKTKISGTPDKDVIYTSCDAGPTLFTVAISFRVIQNEQQTTVAIREKFELTIPGQYL